MNEKEALMQGLRIIDPAIPRFERVTKKQRRAISIFLLHLAGYRYSEISRVMRLSEIRLKQIVKLCYKKYPFVKSFLMVSE